MMSNLKELFFVPELTDRQFFLYFIGIFGVAWFLHITIKKSSPRWVIISSICFALFLLFITWFFIFNIIPRMDGQ